MTSAGEGRAAGDYRLVPAAAGCWVGVVCGQTVRMHWAVLCCAIAITVAVVSLVVAQRKLAILAATWAAFTIGLIVGQAALLTHLNDPAKQVAEDGAFMRMQVQLREEPKVRETQWGQEQVWALADIQGIWHGQEWVPSEARVVLNGPGLEHLHRLGKAEVSGAVELGFRDTAPSIGVVKVRYVGDAFELSPWGKFVTDLRSRLHQATSGLPTEVVALVPAMSIGDDSHLSEERRESMRASSLIHLTVVSGAHMSIAFAALATLLPGYRYLRETASVLFALALIAIVGPQASVIRAGGACLIASWGAIVGRRGRSQTTLALVVCVCVLFDPWSATSFGFALSVLATWGIIFTGRMLVEQIRDLWDARGSKGMLAKLGPQAINAAAVTFSAQLWTLPVLVLLTGYVPTWGIVANLLVAPCLAPITILSLLAAIVAPLSVGLSHWFCLLATPAALWIGGVASVCANLPLARIPWVPGPLGVLVSVVLIGLVVGGMRIWRYRGQTTQ